MLGPGLMPLPLALVLGMAIRLAICGACWHAQQCRPEYPGCAAWPTDLGCWVAEQEADISYGWSPLLLQKI